MSDAPTVVVLGVDSPIGLAVVRDLGRHGCRVVALGRSWRAVGLHSRYATVAALQEPTGEPLLGQIEQFSATHGADHLLAISEHQIAFINDHRPRLSRLFTIHVATAEAMAQVLDKAKTQEVAAQVGIEAPRTWTITPDQPLADQIADVPFPAVLKWANPLVAMPRLSAAGIAWEKAEYAYDATDLQKKLERYAPVGMFPLVQEFVPGYGLGHFFLVRDGEVLLVFQHRRLHEWPPEGGVSTLCESLAPSAHPSVLARSEALVRRLGWEGVAMVEYRYDPSNDRAVLMEVNGRFWGSLPLAIAAGVPFAWGLVAPEPRAIKAQKGAYRVRLKGRYVIPEIRRLARILLQPHLIANRALRFSRGRELAGFFGLYLDPRVRYFVFEWRDPWPFVMDLWGIVRKALGRGS